MGEGRLKIDLILMLCGFLVMGDAGGVSGRELLYELFNLMGLFVPVRSWVVVWAKGLLCRLMLVWRSSCRLVVFLPGVI